MLLYYSMRVILYIGKYNIWKNLHPIMPIYECIISRKTYGLILYNNPSIKIDDVYYTSWCEG